MPSFDVLLVTAGYGDLPGALREKYAGVADAYVLALPAEDRDDGAIGRVIRALKLSSEPPKAGMRFPADLAQQLAAAATAGL